MLDICYGVIRVLESQLFFRARARARTRTRTRKTLTSISHDLSVIVAMEITVGSSTSTASRSTSTASLSTTRTARPDLSRFSTFFVPYVVRKTQTARVHPPHPPPPSPPLGGEGELRKVEVVLQALQKRVRGFLCVFSSLREPCAQDTACFLRLAPLLPLGREQGAGGMRVGRALDDAGSCVLQVNHHLG